MVSLSVHLRRACELVFVERRRFEPVAIPFASRPRHSLLCRRAEAGVQRLSFALNIEKQITSLVHPNVLPRPAERLRHETFILRRLTSSMAVMCLAPLFLAIYGAPALWHALVFVWCIAHRRCSSGVAQRQSVAGTSDVHRQFCRRCGVDRSGRRSLGSRSRLAVLAPFEGALSQNSRLVLAAGALSALAALGLIFVHSALPAVTRRLSYCRRSPTRRSSPMVSSLSSSGARTRPTHVRNIIAPSTRWSAT